MCCRQSGGKLVVIYLCIDALELCGCLGSVIFSEASGDMVIEWAFQS